MKPSPFFHDLRSAYQAELDDLAQDSEGKDVLRKRLAQKRGEIAFLARMIDFSPEMVAVAFHQGFRFHRPATLDPLLARGGVSDLPEWPELAGSVALEPWAQPLAAVVLAEPSGARFLSLAALLEYQRQHARFAGQGAGSAEAGEDDREEGAEEADQGDDDEARWSADDAGQPRSHADREEAAADWMADLGFDRKE